MQQRWTAIEMFQVGGAESLNTAVITAATNKGQCVHYANPLYQLIGKTYHY